MQYGKKHHIDVKARAAGAVIYNRDQKILLVKELQGSKKGLWHIPSGSIEPGELPFETAEREVAEETGLKLKMAHYLNSYVGCFDDGDLVLRHVWIEAFPENQVLAPQLTDEIEAAKFFTQQEIYSLYNDNKLRMHHTKLMIDDAFRFLSPSKE